MWVKETEWVRDKGRGNGEGREVKHPMLLKQTRQPPTSTTSGRRCKIRQTMEENDQNEMLNVAWGHYFDIYAGFDCRNASSRASWKDHDETDTQATVTASSDNLPSITGTRSDCHSFSTSQGVNKRCSNRFTRSYCSSEGTQNRHTEPGS